MAKWVDPSSPAAHFRHPLVRKPQLVLRFHHHLVFVASLLPCVRLWGVLGRVLYWSELRLCCCIPALACGTFGNLMLPSTGHTERKFYYFIFFFSFKKQQPVLRREERVCYCSGKLNHSPASQNRVMLKWLASVYSGEKGIAQIF